MNSRRVIPILEVTATDSFDQFSKQILYRFFHVTDEYNDYGANL